MRAKWIVDILRVTGWWRRGVAVRPAKQGYTEEPASARLRARAAGADAVLPTPLSRTANRRGARENRRIANRPVLSLDRHVAIARRVVKRPITGGSL
jgi:hypothetical protein